MAAILEIRDGTKEYRDVPAIRNVNFVLEPGEAHALLGENGAGKSTLTKTLAGVVAPTSGEIVLEGQPVASDNPADALRRGIVMVHQETSLASSLTVAQNLCLADAKAFSRLRGIYIAAQQFLRSASFPVDPTALVSSIGAGQKQTVEIARAVHHNAGIIIFDEPTGTVTTEEQHQFVSLVERLRARNVSIVFISHAIEEALQMSDRIAALRDCEHVVTDPTRGVERERIARSMVGRFLSDELYGQPNKRKARCPGRKVLSVQNPSMGSLLRNRSFSVFGGQITGVFGRIGSGRTAIARVIAGVCKRDFFHGGQIRLNGRPVRYRVPRRAVRDGIIYVTADCKIEGFLETMSIAENIHTGATARDEANEETIMYAAVH